MHTRTYRDKMHLNVIVQFVLLFYTSMIFEGTQCRPQESFFATTPAHTRLAKRDTISSVEQLTQSPKIVDVDIQSDIQFRYAKTIVKTYIKNPSISNAQEVEFNMVLPDTAFISNFTIQIIGMEEVYVAKVAKKEEAAAHYDEAVQSGKSAGIVDADARYANKITIKSNLEAASKMLFQLTYEEHLQRHTSKYEHIIHVNPGQIIDNFNVNIYINESLPVVNISVPELKAHANDITSQLKPNTIAKINRNVGGNPNRAHVQFHPTIQDQKQMAKTSKREENGMVGQFIVQYDVDRQKQGNEIQVLDGYFVHFFAPDQLEALQRHVVFVLDVSGSMSGVKLKQTKEAMITILNDLSDQDFFNILTFSDSVHNWIPKQIASSEITRYTNQGTSSIRNEAKMYIQNLKEEGGTNINDGLKEALNVVKSVSELIHNNMKPIIIFLTDGQATTGVTGNNDIRINVLNNNKLLNVPIYGLAFGEGADFNLLKGISSDNGALARKIYEASDAAIQLENFYQEIASPLLTDVTFDYVGESFQNNTINKYNTFFKGGEFVIVGKLDNIVEDNAMEIVIRGRGKTSQYKRTIRRCQDSPYNVLPDNSNLVRNGYESKSPSIMNPVDPCIRITSLPTLIHTDELNKNVPKQQKSNAENFIERLWAFLTIKNILEEIQKHSNKVDDTRLKQDFNEKEKEGKALNLALKYNFVTKLTSLYVVKPDNEKLNGQKQSPFTAVNPVPITESKQFYSSTRSNKAGYRRNSKILKSSSAMHLPPQADLGRSGYSGAYSGVGRQSFNDISYLSAQNSHKSMNRYSGSDRGGGGDARHMSYPISSKSYPESASYATGLGVGIIVVVVIVIVAVLILIMWYLYGLTIYIRHVTNKSKETKGICIDVSKGRMGRKLYACWDFCIKPDNVEAEEKEPMK